MRSLAFFNGGTPARSIRCLVGTDTVTAQGHSPRTGHARNGDFYLATTGDLHPATSGDFLMATDKT